MADRLTQLQDGLDDLLMQMFAALNYIQTHHPYGEIAGQPSQASQANLNSSAGRRDSNEPSRTVPVLSNGNGNSQVTDQQTKSIAIKTETTPAPDAQDTFRAALRELAQDLVMQEQKTEILINSLPSTSERDQRQRIQELEAELEQVEAERLSAEKDKTEMLRDLDRLILSLARVH